MADMADLNNNAGSQYQFNLNEVLQHQNEYLERNYTPGENGQRAMLNAELEKAKQAVEQGEGWGILIRNKLDRMMPSELMREEFLKVTIDTLTAAVQPFLKYLEEKEVAYTPDLFQTQIREGAKQLVYTRNQLAKYAAESPEGQRFFASF